jgi:hypothetical protein
MGAFTCGLLQMFRLARARSIVAWLCRMTRAKRIAASSSYRPSHSSKCGQCGQLVGSTSANCRIEHTHPAGLCTGIIGLWW